MPDKKRIIVEQRSADIHVHLEPHRGVWACGKTLDDAIGNLVRYHQEYFEVEVAWPLGPPVLTVGASRLFYDIVAYARRYSRRTTLHQAASDVMDGRCRNDDPEVRELVNKGVLERCGRTWFLTEYGCKAVAGELPSRRRKGIRS